MRAIKQYVFDKTNLILNKNLIADLKVVAFGLQAPPGTGFACNNGNEIIVGQTGIFELDLQGYAYIIDLKVISATLEGEDKIIIDILYESEGKIL